jgi:nucleotide-binding universal stress UspA family protein
MGQCILVGMDATLAHPTRSALELACQVLELDSSACHLILLHVIPVPVDPTPRWDKPLGSWSYIPPTRGQLHQAHRVLQQARALLGQRGIPLAFIEILVRAGTPADELARLARERNVDLLVLGSGPPSRIDFLRRLLLGSRTRRVLRLAPCRVLLACPTAAIPAGDLIAWYEQALQLCLLQQTEMLLVLTPAEVARRFALADQPIGHREIEAAARALKRLASRGLLVCQVVQGEMRCWND